MYTWENVCWKHITFVMIFGSGESVSVNLFTVAHNKQVQTLHDTT